MTDTLLHIKNLQTWLGNEQAPVRAVDGVDLEICKSETFALLGESGCGKSMTALSIMRLLPQAGRIVGGSIRLGETSLLDLPEHEMRNERGGRMGMIFQEPMTSLNPVLTTGTQIAEAVRIHDFSYKQDVQARVVELLTAVGISDPEQRSQEYPHQLSGGMKQRVMIAMALAGRPELLIADEPTTALDVTIQAQVLALMQDLQQETGMAILLITHDLGVVAEVADRVAVMYAGQIVEVAACKEFFQNPQHPYSRKLFQSIPSLDKRTQRLAVIKGTVPPLNQEFIGCRFADRCDAVMDLCRQQAPTWSQNGVGQGVRCHLNATEGQINIEQQEVLAVEEVTASEISEQPLLAVSDLKVHFPIHKGVFRRVVGHVRAVDGVSLEILPGRTLAVVGESGCGKTTVGKAILQLIRPTDGTVRFEDDELTQMRGNALRSRRSDLQIIFQDPMASMNPRMLVHDIIEEGMLAQSIGGNAAQRRERVCELLEQVGLPTTAADLYPHEFSGGQRQRICVARALAVEPKLIICDEPTSALDVSVQAQILNLLQELQQRQGLSYLFITHDISVVSYLAHEVAVMYLGRIVERGTVTEVLENPQHPYTQALLSAVPVAEHGRKQNVIRLEGDMPSPSNPPDGCHFHPRCPRAEERCRHGYPEIVQLSETRSASCVLLGDSVH
ncbi:ABC transporter, ATP-binding protein (cluster 5, nickel/peptides/opines) / ABC transporter, ATP-binding protein (cluster 5, nickel/peptides/opines) [hydrothermal vent metagenome]|uniref:ABC transporter, ATP-binding protein (Cluster 5, nickel/peptides/opines) / ABC transporter, ATP-binding protein (Cluster 5, nickel/peptides/opines) n=1 Tax=hydrothermal vent metagenome TaxID=652676 RepID=A0A3B1BRI6_9ZZZZ